MERAEPLGAARTFLKLQALLWRGRRRMAPAIRPCDFCGLWFAPRKSDQRFCSPEHNRAWWRDFYKTHTHACPFCGMRHRPHWQRGSKLPALERDAYAGGVVAGGGGGGP